MIKKLYALLIIILTVTSSIFAQIAPNFNCNDCSGVNHDLHSQIAAGKVIVICWVMPCGSCIGPALTSYNAVQNYQNNYPGRVLLYLVDDFANTVCSSLISWANSYSMPAAPFLSVFSDASIDMMDYGSIGMPKVVVVGPGNNVFYHADNEIEGKDLMTAIENALVSTGINDHQLMAEATLLPNPSAGEVQLIINTQMAEDFDLEILDITGRILLKEKLHVKKGQTGYMFENQNLKNGMYFIRLSYQNHYKILSFIIAK